MNKLIPSRSLLIVTFTLFSILSLSGYAQDGLSLKEIPELVQRNLPQLQAAKMDAEASRTLITAEKQTLIPDVTVAYQANLATYNNITGMSYPGLLMPVSGPPSANNNINFIPGSAATALIIWRPLTFGQRNAAIDRATSQYNLANASYNQDLFRYQYMAITSYLEALYYQQIKNSQTANIKRFNSNLDQSLELAKSGLKPGIDTVQLQSAIAQAEIELLQSEYNLKQKLLEIKRLTGLSHDLKGVSPSDTLLYSRTEFAVDTVLNVPAHPSYKAAEAQKELAEARLVEVERSWRPKMDVWSNVYGRGSGIDASGNVSGQEGFNLSRHNLGIGFQLSFPLLQFYQVNNKKKQFEQMLKADEYRTDQVALDLKTQAGIVFEKYAYNLKIADKTMFRLKSAADAYQSLKISYEAGLVDFTRLSQSLYELQQAEINNANARLSLLNSLLEISIAKGDLTIFLNQIR